MDIIQPFLIANSTILSNSFWQQQYLINSFKNCSSQSTPLKILKTTGPVTLGKRLACWLLNDWFRSAIEMFYLNNLFKMLSCVSICSVQINSGSTLSWYQVLKHRNLNQKVWMKKVFLVFKWNQQMVGSWCYEECSQDIQIHKIMISTITAQTFFSLMNLLRCQIHIAL